MDDNQGGTLDALLEEYLTHIKGLGQSPATMKGVRHAVRGFLRHLRSVHQIDTPDGLRRDNVLSWHKTQTAGTSSKGLPYRPKSINKAIASVRGFLKHLALRGFVLPSILDALEYVKVPSLLPLDALTHAQVRRLVGKVDASTPEGQRDRTMLELLYTSGIRAGELVKLDVGDADLGNAVMRVMGKGSKERMVPVGRSALRCLETYIKAVRRFLLVSGDCPALFINRRGSRLGYLSVLATVHRTADAAGIDVNVTPHTFRRSCATELVRGGANLYHVKELLGHESLDTLRHYTKLTINDLKRTHAKCHPRERDGG